jgi:hypothetical protein
MCQVCWISDENCNICVVHGIISLVFKSSVGDPHWIRIQLLCGSESISGSGLKSIRNHNTERMLILSTVYSEVISVIIVRNLIMCSFILFSVSEFLNSIFKVCRILPPHPSLRPYIGLDIWYSPQLALITYHTKQFQTLYINQYKHSEATASVSWL